MVAKKSIQELSMIRSQDPARPLDIIRQRARRMQESQDPRERIVGDVGVGIVAKTKAELRERR
jgi:hypothetical protein